MLSFLFDGPVEPVHQLPHPARSFKRRCGLKHHAQAFAVWSNGLDIIGNLFHGDNTGSNPVGDANKESATSGLFRRNFVGTKRHNFHRVLGLPHLLKF
jgi:hypothetical protein